MKIGLFIPCFMNELYPNICKATYNLLKSQNLQIEYPLSQTCCGQPMANSGCSKDVKTLAINFVNTFKDYDYIVAPSGNIQRGLLTTDCPCKRGNYQSCGNQ